MTLLRWQPQKEWANLHRRFNQMLENDYFHGEEDTAVSCWTPAADILENKDSYVFKIELPGISKDDVSIEFENSILTINGERKEEKEVKEDNLHRSERCFGTFSRTFRLPKNIDEKKIDAKMKDGILELTVPKAEKVKAKSIPINVN